MHLNDAIYYTLPEGYSLLGLIPVESSFLFYFNSPTSSQELKIASTIKIEAIKKLIDIVNSQPEIMG